MPVNPLIFKIDKMDFKTLKDKESYLNDYYSDSYAEQEALHIFIYLTNKSRGNSTTESHIIKCYHEQKLGSLLRRLDSVAFHCA